MISNFSPSPVYFEWFQAFFGQYFWSIYQNTFAGKIRLRSSQAEGKLNKSIVSPLKEKEKEKKEEIANTALNT